MTQPTQVAKHAALHLIQRVPPSLRAHAQGSVPGVPPLLSLFHLWPRGGGPDCDQRWVGGWVGWAWLHLPRFFSLCVCASLSVSFRQLMRYE